MGTEFALVVEDRSELNYDLLSFKGMAVDARVRMREAEEKKKIKEAAKAAKAAEEAVDEKDDEKGSGSGGGDEV